MAENDFFKKVLNTGEEQFGKIAAALLRNEGFVSGLQSAVARALEAKGLADRQVASALGAMHVPTRQDMQKLNDRMEELERIFEELSNKVDGIAAGLEKKG